MEQLISRLDSFIFKLRERFLDIISSAEEPLNETIEKLQYDTIVLHNILTGLKYQTVEQLTQKAQEGWDKFYNEAGKQSVFNYSKANEHHKKIDLLIGWMSKEFYLFQINTYSKAAHKILDNVKKHINENKKHTCTQCGAGMNINIYSFMAKNIKCEYCGCVNTYEPDDRIRALEYYVITHLANEHAFPAWLNANAEVRMSPVFSDEYIRNFSVVSGKTDVSRRDAGAEYYRKYYGFLMDNIPDKKEFFERQMNERIGWLSREGYLSDIFLPS